jgi:hypothetical protein
MLLSLFVYIFLGFLMFALGRIAWIRQQRDYSNSRRSVFWSWEVLFIFGIFSFIAGMRWDVGVDHLSYLKIYLDQKIGTQSELQMEPLFQIVTQLFSSLGVHYVFYFAFLAFVQIFFVYRAVKDERYLYPFIGIVIVFGPEYFSWMNTVRQAMAATVFMWSVQYIVKRQLLPFAAAIIIASLIHKSAIILFPLYWILRIDLFKYRAVALFALFASIYISSMGLLSDEIGIVPLLFSNLNYDWMADNYDLLIDAGDIRSFGPRRIGIILTAIITIAYSRHLRARFCSTKFSIYYNLSIAGVVMYNLFANMHHIFLRPVMYFTIFSILTTAYCFRYLADISFFAGSVVSARRIIGKLVFVLLCVTSLNYTIITVISDGQTNRDHSLYQFFWDGDIQSSVLRQF